MNLLEYYEVLFLFTSPFLFTPNYVPHSAEYGLRKSKSIEILCQKYTFGETMVVTIFFVSNYAIVNEYNK